MDGRTNWAPRNDPFKAQENQIIFALTYVPKNWT